MSAAAPDHGGEPGAAAGSKGKAQAPMSTVRAINEYLDDRRRTGGVTRYTAQHMRAPLYAFAEVVPDEASKITRRSVLTWLGSLDHLGAGTRGLYFTRVRGFTTWLLRRGVIRRDPFLDVPPPKVPRSVHRCLDGGQARALLAACDTPRATVIVMLGLHTGLRRAELAGLDIGALPLEPTAAPGSPWSGAAAALIARPPGGGPRRCR